VNHSIGAADALLFDLGGVLIDVDFDRAFQEWGRRSGIPAAVLRARFSIDSFYEQHERGEISAGEYFESLRNSLQISLSDRELEIGWNAILGEEIKDVTILLAHARPNIPLYVFSNSNLTHHRYWANKFHRMLSHFQRVFVSSEIGHRKPDPEAFLFVSKQIGVPLERIMFFDDTAENVLAARCLGMDAVQVTSVASVRNALVRYGNRQ
jgi:FMN phosphatase YigB (HAD superfamily)